MTSLYDEGGKNLACTVIEAGPCIVTQLKNDEKDGYSSVQLGFNDKKETRFNKSEKGHAKKANTDPKTKLVEFKGFEEELKIGDTINVSHFVEGEFVDVSGISKGKGFQGGVKRHNFRMQDATHGNSISHRAPGSIGQCQTPGRVFKGKKMAGQMGSERKPTQRLEVIRVDAENNLLLIKGAIPGATGASVIVRPTIKVKR